MAKPRKSYTKEEKLEIVKLSLADNESIKGLSARYGIVQNTLYNWRNKYTKNKESAFPGKGNKMLSEEGRKIEELEKELRETRLERDILKKAVGIFSKSDQKFSNL